MSDEIAITVDHVSKTFKLPHEKVNSIKGAVVNFYRRKRTFEKQEVLRDISVEIKKGEFFGIVGRNGSGKSTLLKMLAGIYAPTKGNIHINGKLTPFIELGVGFNPELTGRENVFLNGALLGFNRAEMKAMYHDIVAFAELEKFMDQKLKNYSSGMQVRLAFSIAIRAQSDILLIDEVLAVGDASFQQKCYDVFAELKKAGTTMILVTHDMAAVMRFCDRAALIHNGDIEKIASPADIADLYLELNYKQEDDQGATKLPKDTPRITSVELFDSKGHEQYKYDSGDSLKAKINFSNTKKLPLHFGLQLFNEAGVYCFGTNTKASGEKALARPGGSISIDLKLELVPGTYYVTAATMNENATTVFDYEAKIAKFRISKNSEFEGVAMLSHSWESSDV